VKRLVAAVAALLIAASTAFAVPARLLVTSQRAYGPGSSNAKLASFRATEDKQIVMVTGLLDRMGINYSYAPPEAMRTEFARTGKMVWDYGTAAARVEQFDGLLIINAIGKLGDTTPYWNPESLTFSATVTGTEASHGRSVPAIPVLEIFSHLSDMGVTGANQALRDSAGRDSIGLLTTGTADFRRGWTTCQLVTATRPEGSANAWWSTGYVAGMTPNTTRPAGGLRGLLRHQGNTASSLYFYESDGEPGSNVASWLDSMEFNPSANGAGLDTFVVIERMMNHITGAKPITFAYPFGMSSCLGDSSQSSSHRVPCEYDVPTVMWSIYHLDSLLGKRLVQKKIQASVVLRGAASRSGYRNSGGMFPGDENNVYDTRDSLRRNCPKIKWTIATNTDSAAHYASELNEWKRLGNVRFTPTNMRGVLDTLHVSTGTPAYGADPLGRYRARTVAVGPYNLVSGVPQDTSLYSLLRYERAKLASVVGENVSGCLVAPMDDWTPKNTRPFRDATSGVSLSPDSVLFAIKSAGFTTIMYNSQRPFSAATMIGYKVPKQGTATVVMRGGAKFSMRFLAHTGYSIAGSALQQDMRADSVLIPGVSNNCNALTLSPSSAYAYNQVMIPAYEHHRWWYGLTMNRYRDYDFMIPFWFDAWEDVNKPKDDVLYDLKAANIVTLSVQDFGSGGFARPSRPGYWAIKSLYNAFEAMNAAAGRTVCEFVFPEELNP